MTHALKTLIAAGLVAVTSSAAFADGHAFDADTARLDLTLDTDGDGEVSDDEIIDGNMALFDLDGNGTLNAAERGQAELAVMN